MVALSAFPPEAEQQLKTLRDAKLLLDGHGYRVIPKDRVRRLGAQAFISLSALHQAHDAGCIQDHFRRNMCHALADELMKYFDGRFDGEEQDGMMSYRVQFDVITPETTCSTGSA